MQTKQYHRLLALLMTVVMVFQFIVIAPHAAFAEITETEVVSENEEQQNSPKAGETAEDPDEGSGSPQIRAAKAAKTVLAFTSDIHNGTAQGSESNIGNNRLTTWLNNVMPKYDNSIKVFGFCGDMAAASSNATTFWTFTQTVMNNIEVTHSLTGVYAVGNHEYMNGSFDSTSNSPEVRGKYKLNAEARAVEDENYVIYCLGTNSGHGSSWAYDDSQITTLKNYLKNASKDKVIIILTHFPLHDYGSHRTSNTAPVLQALNEAAVGADGNYGTDDDKKIVFLWGHNHSEGDTNYDEVWLPGDKINDNNNSTVYFFYAAAGSMADSEYGQSGRIKGKGLVLEIDAQNKLAFTYYDANGNNVTEPDSQTISEQDPVPATGVSIVETNPTVDEGRKLQLHLSYTPSDANSNKSVVWSSSDTTVATVDETGLVKGLKEGTTTITVTAADNSYSASRVVTVNHNDNPYVEEVVNITPASSNSPEETISINVGDTIIVNVTNGSSSSTYTFTASLSKNGVVTNEGSTSVSIAAGATEQFTFSGVADGTVDITIQNSNQYGSQYVRKGTIHVTVGEGGDTPVDPPVGDTVSITPSTENPEESIKIAVGDTLTINVTNGSTSSAYDFTASLSKSGVVQNNGSSSVNIASGATGQFTFTGLADGTVDITIQNNSSYGSQYVRKGIVHVTVGEGGDTPVDPPVGDTVSITPSTENPEESIKISVDDTLTINVTNGSTSSAYDFTATLSNSGIAQIQGNSTVNIAAGSTAQFTVKGLAEGTVDITIQNENSYGSQYVRKGVVHLTVGDGSTPVDPPVGETVTYQLATSFEEGKEYIIASGNSGSVYVISDTSTGSSTNTGLVGISATAENDSITLSAANAAKAAFTAEIKTSSQSDTTSVWLKHDGKYLYTASSGGLRISSEQTDSGNTGKFWHYKADSKYLLWYFKDTSSSDGYTDTGSTYRYYISCSSGTFKYNYVGSGSSLSGTDTPKIYVYVKYEGPEVPAESVTLDKTTLSLAAGETAKLTATVLPTNATNKTVTWSSSNNNVAKVENGTVTAVAAGSATITATIANGESATCSVSVTVAPSVTYTLTDHFEEGKEYIIANGNSGSVYVISDTSTGSGTSTGLVGISATAENDSITLSATNAAKAAFTAEIKTSSQSDTTSVWLKHDGKYLYTASSGGLRISSEQTDSGNTGKFWHYKADDKDLLWYFKDTSSSDGYTNTGSTYRYYIKCSSTGTFTYDYVGSNSSLSGTDTPKINIFEKSDQQSSAGNCTIEISASKTEVLPGDTVTFTIKLLKPVEHLGSIRLLLDIPEGLTFVSGDINEDLNQIIHFESGDDGNGVFFDGLLISGYGTEDYSGNIDIELATFDCTVDEDFTGPVTVAFDEDDFEVCSVESFEPITTSVTGAEIRLHTHNWTVNWNWTADENGGYSAASMTITCTTDTTHTKTVNVVPVATEDAGYKVYTATVAAEASPDGTAHTDEKRVPITYNIAYTLNGGSVATDNPKTYTVEDLPITLNNPTRTGYEFGGWTGSGLNTATQNVTISTGTTGDLSFTATWEQKGYEVSGIITSYVGTRLGYPDYVYEEGHVSVILYAADTDTIVAVATVSDDNKTYTLTEVEAGTYELKVMKKDHAPRTYTITVTDTAVTQDVEIRLYGDVDGNGKVTTIDAAMINYHAKATENLTGYDLIVADVIGNGDLPDGKVSTIDAAAVNSHAKGENENSFLW